MAISLINRNTATASGQTAVLAAFTPAAGSRLYACGVGSSDGSTIGVPVVSGGGLTWNAIRNWNNQTTGNRNTGQLYYANVATAASTTVQSQSSSAGAAYISCVEISGFDPADVGAAINSGLINNSTNGDTAAVLDNTPAADSWVLCWYGGGITGASLTSDPDFTELHDVGTFGRIGLQYRQDGTHNTASWTSTNTRCGSIIVEIPVAAIDQPVTKRTGMAAGTSQPGPFRGPKVFAPMGPCLWLPQRCRRAA